MKQICSLVFLALSLTSVNCIPLIYENFISEPDVFRRDAEIEKIKPQMEELRIEKMKPDFSPFGKFVFELSYPDLFEKAFDPSFTPSEARYGIQNHAILFSQQLGLPCGLEGLLPFHLAQATSMAFERGISPMTYFDIFMKTLENYLLKENIMTPCNIQVLGYKYYSMLEDSFKSRDKTSTPLSRLYSLAKVNADFLSSFTPVQSEKVQYLMMKLTDEFNRVAQLP